MSASVNPPEKTADLLATILADLADLIGRIPAARQQDPTPCESWDIAQLQSHVAGWLDTFAAGFAHPDGTAPRSSLDEHEPPRDAAAAAEAVRDSAATLDAAIRAGVPGQLTLGEGSMPGTMALDMIVWEYLVHGWDLARAAGQPWSPPAEAVGQSLAFAPGMLTPGYQGEGKTFGPRVTVPADASPFERLLGLSGRDPRWTAAAPAGDASPHRQTTLTARFTVDGADPAQVPGIEDDWARMLIFRKTFTAGITGTATTVFLAAGPQEGARSYVATERITGRAPDGREGAVTIQHGGLESDPDAWFGHIVPHTGTGGFAGWSGTARVCHDADGTYFEITLGR